jgi:Fe-S-cluster containining protein
MNKFPCNTCKGECCSSFVPFTIENIKQLKKNYPSVMKKVSKEKIDGLPTYFLKIKGKKIEDEMCIFYSGKCDVYNHRPEVCEKFGNVPKLKCPYEIKEQ